MSTPNVTQFEQANEAYADGFTQGDLALPPSKKYAVVTCMDARIDPAAAFGIPLGAAHIIRNAGGSAHEALRSIIISQQLLGTTEIFLVKHTGCGMLTFTTPQACEVISKNLGREAAEEVKGLDFLTFADLDRAVRDEVQWLRGRKTVPGSVGISGWVYKVETGRARRVV